MSNTRIRIGLLGALLAVVACGTPSEFAATGAQRTSDAPEHHRGEHPHSRHAEGLAAEVGVLTDHSVYHLDSEWWNQHGEVNPLRSLAGRVQVVSMVYTHCSYTCPRILADMKRLEGEIADPGRLGFVLVSIDPERDTPDRLLHFAEATRLDSAAWTLLSGSDDSVLELATLLGIKFRRDGETDFSHSNTILVLNPSGEVVYRQMGLGEDPAPMLAAIRQALPPAAPHHGS